MKTKALKITVAFAVLLFTVTLSFGQVTSTNSEGGVGVRGGYAINQEVLNPIHPLKDNGTGVGNGRTIQSINPNWISGGGNG